MAGGRGRKPIHLEMRGSKSNRQRIWEAIRAERDGFQVADVAHRAKTDITVVNTYVQSLLRGEYVELISGAPYKTQTLRLIKDVGAEAPSLTKEGKPSNSGKGTEAMWRTLRILGELDAHELAAQASTVTPTTPSTAASYLLWLKKAGYVIEVLAGKPGRKARYSLAPGKYTGPRPPMIQKIGQVFDPNLSKVVFRQPAPAETEL